MLNKPTEWAFFTLVCKTNLPLSDKDYDNTFSVHTAQFVVKGGKNQIDQNSTYLWWMLMCVHLLFCSVWLFSFAVHVVLPSFHCFDFAVYVFVSMFLIDSLHFVHTHTHTKIKLMKTQHIYGGCWRVFTYCPILFGCFLLLCLFVFLSLFWFCCACFCFNVFDRLPALCPKIFQQRCKNVLSHFSQVGFSLQLVGCALEAACLTSC